MKTRHADMAVEQLEQGRKAFLKGDIYLDFKRGGETEDFLMDQRLRFAQILVEILQNRLDTDGDFKLAFFPDLG